MGKKIMFFFMLILLLGCKITSTKSITETSVPTQYSSTTQASTTNKSSTTTTHTTTRPQQDEPNWFKLSGFAQGYITDRSNLQKVQVENELQFIEALNDKNIKVIEIKSDLNLGYYELQKQFDVSKYSIVKPHNTPLLHPTLMETGVSKIYIQDRNAAKKSQSLLIYSSNGNTIKHASFIIRRSEDIVFRNLKFSELWEFDESSKGDYDRNDWDYFTIEESSGIWLDHLEFDKAYDGLIDLKKGSNNVTISWSKFVFEPNDFLYTQFNYLEENKDKYPMYKFLRDGGMSIDEIVLLNSSQKKGHLIGSTELDESNKALSLTLHHNLYQNLQDRLPRLRAGNVHLYNIILDNSNLLSVKETLNQKYPKIMNSGTYKIGLTNQGIVTTENGAVLMENSLFRGVETPIKNNQKNTEVLYTGKYQVMNSIYNFKNQLFIGGSSDQNTPFIGKPASIVEFSWNQMECLPYHYELIDVNDLETYINQDSVGTIVTNENWLNIKEVVR